MRSDCYSEFHLVSWEYADELVKSVLGVGAADIMSSRETIGTWLQPDGLFELAQTAGLQPCFSPVPQLENWQGDDEEGLGGFLGAALQAQGEVLIVNDDSFHAGGPFCVSDGNIAAFSKLYSQHCGALFSGCEDLVFLFRIERRFSLFHHSAFVCHLQGRQADARHEEGGD